ncbi:MAG: polysaccharide biosynthesis tyrosine autokinase [Pontiellaceae bacterium]|nr:polysaccharide biosynthesis tyrosine autokinase [Pontiellaceae bacterium]
MSLGAEVESQKSLHFLDYWRVIRSRKEIVLAVACLIIITGVVYTLLLDPMYESQSRISISKDMLSVDPITGEQQYFTYDPYYITTQLEIMKARRAYQVVVERLDLLKEWGKDGQQMEMDQAVKILKKRIDIVPGRDTSIVNITVRMNNPVEAANIANTFAEVYRDSRREIADAENRNAILEMEKQWQQQQEIVSEAEDELNKIVVDLQIASVGEGGVDIDEYRMQQLMIESLSAQREKMQLESTLSILEGITDEDLVKSASAVTDDVTVMNAIQRLAEVRADLSAAKAQYGEEHPERMRLENQEAQWVHYLDQRLEGMRLRVQKDYDIAKEIYDSMALELETVKEETIKMKGEKYKGYRTALADVERARAIYDQLGARLRQHIIRTGAPKNSVEIFDRATAEKYPVSPNLFLNTLISIFVGFGAGVGLAYFIEYLDTSIKTADDVERILGLPVLGLIPQKVRPLIEEGPDSEHAEAYRVLRTNLAFTESGSSRGAFSVLSSGAGEGKSTTVFNLAFICAQQGEKVLLIDADLRRPVQHTILGVSNRFGLTNVLLRDVPVEEGIKATSVPNLHFLPSGRLPRTSLGVLDPKRIGELIASLKEKYDVVLIDTPPLVGISDSSIIAKETDGAILVVQYRKYPRDMLAKAKQMIEALGVKVIGAVLNNINIMRDDYYYYNSYYSDYYYHSTQSDPDSEDGI